MSIETKGVNFDMFYIQIYPIIFSSWPIKFIHLLISTWKIYLATKIHSSIERVCRKDLTLPTDKNY